ncbi:MAG: RnfH family protein [Magnetococcales bacterium]|nr:RnfH family protein [Magnetococcales bacterium]
MRVAVTYAEPRKQMLLEFEVPEGYTAEQAIRRSGILGKCPQIDLAQQKIGIYSRLVPLEQVLQPGDRVEIYRPAVGKPPKKSRDKPSGTVSEDESED